MPKSLKNNSLPSRTAPPTAAATAILDVAERLAQTLGYNGFSYADIAAQLGVTKASLHYHFPTKAELGRALIERYRILFGATLEARMQKGLKLFFDANERWLTAVLEDGLRAGTFLFREPANERARVLLGALEGAMLVARSYGNPHRFQAAAVYLLADLGASRRSTQRRTQ